MNEEATHVVQRNGQTAAREALIPLAFAGHAHFTAMQVRGGKVRGLDLHLARLRDASVQLFGQALPDHQVLAYLRSAVEAGPGELSLTATVYSPEGEFVPAPADAKPAVLIRTGPPASGPAGPLRLQVFEYERVLPAVKHVGEVAKTYFLRRAVAQGFDDAAFVDRYGRISEGSIWNLAFWDGSAVVWPVAQMLGGTTMAIVRRQLDRLGVPQREQVVTLADLASMAGALVMNSWTPGVAVHGIGPTALPEAPDFVTLLHRAYELDPLTSLVPPDSPWQ
ncbi:aminotransferase class IV family protein [Rubrivivax gelatinosus]|uniref:Branched-chain amino acid aminotransferase n=1 Tax=Rubrivivax gelatinosus TaxID=28068 RepID=A0ABS1E109_RUBGE|nr:aminotransferase class IV family protein [Rubrivivax gelatinosus]MBK1715393.1 branched-chain amino acid aminotransferase [Rubrivivax gelatinosus]